MDARWTPPRLLIEACTFVHSHGDRSRLIGELLEDGNLSVLWNVCVR